MNIIYKALFGIFEWDSEKNLLNIEKHGICFTDSVKIFSDVNCIFYQDLDHSYLEEHYKIVGKLDQDTIAIAIFTESNSRYRIISSRLATKKERSDYAINSNY